MKTNFKYVKTGYAIFCVYVKSFQDILGKSFLF